MARGSNPNSRENLKKANQKPKDVISAERSKAGKASGEVRSFRASVLDNLTEQRLANVTNKLIMMAEHGNMKAQEMLCVILDGKPKEQVQIETVNENQFSKLTEEELRALASEHTGSDPE